jgi:glycosyltransferase involved in cell wall biosynthesis
MKAISQCHDLWVIVGAQFRDEIEAELNSHPELRRGIQFHYIRRVRFATIEKVWPPAYLFTYKHQWQSAALAAARSLHQQVNFDIVHQLTYVGFRVPGRLWTLGVPFVWGPIGGLEQTTWALLPSLGLKGCLHFAARNLMNDWDRRFSLLPKRAFRAAEGGIIAATTEVQRQIRRFYRRESIVISEVGLPPSTRHMPVRRQTTEPLRLLWSGLHLPGKALPFLFEALQKLPSSYPWRLTILGDGRCRAKWEKIARQKGLSERCEWLGQVPRLIALAHMQQAHALVVTSVHDLTSTVVVEALANGLPVVCPEHCGFKDAVNSSCGMLVNASYPGLLITEMTQAIEHLYDEDFRFALARGALDQSRKFEWAAKASALSNIYYARTPASVGSAVETRQRGV